MFNGDRFFNARNSALQALARLWIVGRSPYAPGTCGTLVALALAPLAFMPLPIWARLPVLCLLFWVGLLASTEAEKALGNKDPQEVIIDEVFGMWLTLLPFASLSLMGYALAFLLFRLFDIVKPWPVREFEKLPSGLGIMADDAVAGLMASVCTGALLCFLS